MKAIRCPRYGSPEVLEFAEVPLPTPKANEVRVRIRATSVTVADSRIRGFNVPRAFWIPARLALGVVRPKNSILGVELAGDIDALGADVKNFQPGTPVYGATLSGMGAYAQYICLPANGAIANKPSNLSYEEAAAIPIGACTALHFLNKADVKPGQHIMVYGASGSVGTYTIQLAKYFGAEVTAVCSSKNAALVKSLGADHVIDYRQNDFEARLGEYDIVFVAIDKIPFSICNRILKKGGVYLNITAAFKNPAMIWASMTDGKRIFTGQNTQETAADLQFLSKLIEDGRMKVVIDRTFRFDQIVEAHRHVDAGHKIGNVAVTVD